MHVASTGFSAADTTLHKLYKLADAPEYFCCPISQDIMLDPVLLVETGHVFERAIIQDWLREHNTCPLTGIELSSKELAPVHVFRSMTNDYKHKFIKKSIPMIVELLKHDLTQDQVLQIKDMLILANEYANSENENILVILLRVLAILNDYAELCTYMTLQMDRLHIRCDKRQIVNTITVALHHFGPALKDNIDAIISSLASSPHRVDHLLCFKDALLVERMPKEAAKVCRYLSPMLHFVDRRADGLRAIIEAIYLDNQNDEFYETLLKSLKDRETLAEFCKYAVDESTTKMEDKIVSKKLNSILDNNERCRHLQCGIVYSNISSFEEQFYRRAIMSNEYRLESKMLIKARLSRNMKMIPTHFESRNVFRTDNQVWCAIQLDENTVATSHQKGGFVRIWDMKKRQNRLMGRGVEAMEYLWEMCAAGNDLLICGSRSFSLFHVFNWKTGKLQNTIKHTASINSAGHAAFQVFGKYLIAALKDGTTVVWDFVKPGGEIVRVFSGHKNYVNCIEMLPNGMFATGSVDTTIKIWSIDSDNCIHTIERAHECGVTSLCLLDEKTLVSAGGSDDKKVKLWDLSTLKCIKVMKGHELVIKQITRLNDTMIATGSWDKTVRVWDTTTGECVRKLEGHTDQVLGVIGFNDQIISVSKDRTMRVWQYNDERSCQ
jgi:hypothetical protein